MRYVWQLDATSLGFSTEFRFEAHTMMKSCVHLCKMFTGVSPGIASISLKFERFDNDEKGNQLQLPLN